MLSPYFLLKHREPQSSNAKLLLPIIPIGNVAYAFKLLWENLCRNSCILIMSFTLKQSLKTTRFIGVWCGSLPLKNATLFLPSPKYRRLSFTKKFGSRMELTWTFRRLAHVKRHIPNRNETSGSVSWIFEFGGSLFFSLCGVLDVKKYFCFTAV